MKLDISPDRIIAREIYDFSKKNDKFRTFYIYDEGKLIYFNSFGEKSSNVKLNGGYIFVPSKFHSKENNQLELFYPNQNNNITTMDFNKNNLPLYLESGNLKLLLPDQPDYGYGLKLNTEYFNLLILNDNNWNVCREIYTKDCIYYDFNYLEGSLYIMTVEKSYKFKILPEFSISGLKPSSKIDGWKYDITTDEFGIPVFSDYERTDDEIASSSEIIIPTSTLELGENIYAHYNVKAKEQIIEKTIYKGL